MIRTESVTKLFRTEEIETSALYNVTLGIQDGEFVAIMGPSGCGKSTLLNILGLLDSPSDGRYFFEGQDVSRTSERQRAGIRKANIGFVFQSFNLIDELTVFENVELPLCYMGVSTPERERRVGKRWSTWESFTVEITSLSNSQADNSSVLPLREPSSRGRN